MAFSRLCHARERLGQGWVAAAYYISYPFNCGCVELRKTVFTRLKMPEWETIVGLLKVQSLWKVGIVKTCLLAIQSGK